jgi:dimethylamine/trimethylamine dehydrogenase
MTAQTSRFSGEGFQEDYIKREEADDEACGRRRPLHLAGPHGALVKGGVLDMIGAARPSIADPFLPKKIEEGRLDDIRECIGCNMCVTGRLHHDQPALHPEPHDGRGMAARLASRTGCAGPAGLEAALTAARRGYDVHLAEAGTELGGRVVKESKLPGLAAWIRVRDWRVGQLQRLPNVTVYRDSRLNAEDVAGFGAEHVVIATGATWRRDGVGRDSGHALPGFDHPAVLTPDDIFAGRLPEGPVTVWDDDHFYLGGVIAERCAAAGLVTTYVTSALQPSAFAVNTLEATAIAKRLVKAGITLVTRVSATSFTGESLTVVEHLSGTARGIPARGLVTVTARLPNDSLHDQVRALKDTGRADHITSLHRIGDCNAPATIQAAVYAGHRWARELDETEPDVFFPRELPKAAPLRRFWG